MLKKYSIRLLARKIIKQKFFKDFVLKNIPKVYTMVESSLKFEKDVEFKLLPVLCDSSKVSLDIGVLWGAYAYEMKKHSDSVICYEPNPMMCEHLKSVFGNSVEVNNLGLSDHSGYMLLRIPNKRPGNSTIELENTLNDLDDIREVIVKVIALDTKMPKNVGFVKIDVEGHELNVLHGMKNLLQKDYPNILVEVEERHREDSVSNVTAFLKSLEYQVFFLREDVLHPAETFSKRLQSVDVRRTPEYTKNFIAIHQNNCKEVLAKLVENYKLTVKS